MPILWILVTAHALWAYVVYSHLLLQHISSVNCPLWCFYEPGNLNQAVLWP